MIKFIKVKIIKTEPGSTDVLMKFEGRGVIREQYLFLEDRLDNFRLYMNPEELLKSEAQYDESLKKLLISLTFRTPDRYMPTDIEKAVEKFMGIMNTFQNFYEAQNEIFKKLSKK